MHNKEHPISLLEQNVRAKEQFFRKIDELPAEEVTIKRKPPMSADQGIFVRERMLRMNGEVRCS
tara:strand:- start:50 stop:241 length:192 start_codon:yes stop_codon:yes gene_type:complete